MARDTVDVGGTRRSACVRAVARSGCALLGAEGFRLACPPNIPTPTSPRRYGSEAAEVKALIALDPSLAEPLVPGPAVRAGRGRPRRASRDGDHARRRARCAGHALICTTARACLAAAPDVAELLGRELGWSAAERGAPGRRLPRDVRGRDGGDATGRFLGVTAPTSPIELDRHRHTVRPPSRLHAAGRLRRAPGRDHRGRRPTSTTVADASRDWWPLAMHWALAGQVPQRAAVVARPADTSQVSQVLALCDEARRAGHAGGRSQWACAAPACRCSAGCCST